MINRTAIQQWSNHAPWIDNAQIEQDMQSLLRPGISFNASDAYPLIYETFIDKMKGKRD